MINDRTGCTPLETRTVRQLTAWPSTRFLRGFTLIETLVAIAVMTVALLAPFAAIERVVAASRIAKDNLIASTLAQEAIEYVRFIRYNNYLAYRDDVNGYQSHILDGLNSAPNCTNGNRCTVDTTVALSAAVASCQNNSCGPLYLDANGFYTQNASGGSKTLFTRSLTLTQDSVHGNETATVTITWEDHGNQSMTLSETYYDWL